MEYELDDNPSRIPRDAVWAGLCATAYWGRGRVRADLEAQLDASWRVVGAYRSDTGELVGFARSISDGVAFAYLADVFVLDSHRGQGLGTRLISRMIDEGPGAHFRWTLFTRDAHDLYARFGFAAPDATAMVRPATTV